MYCIQTFIPIVPRRTSWPGGGGSILCSREHMSLTMNRGRRYYPIECHHIESTLTYKPDICFCPNSHTIDFNVANRSQAPYSMLPGSMALCYDFIIVVTPSLPPTKICLLGAMKGSTPNCGTPTLLRIPCNFGVWQVHNPISSPPITSTPTGNPLRTMNPLPHT